MPSAKPKAEKICPTCKTVFYVRPSIADKRRCCSVKCQGLWKRSKRSEIDCLTCSKKFTVRPSDIKFGRKYCSRECTKPMYSELLKDNQMAKDLIPWNKGVKGVKTGKKGPRPHMAGENNHNWKGGITSKDKLTRVKFRKTMQLLVFQRDDFTCQICYKEGEYLQVDHIKKWSDYPELRFDMDNCRTLCMPCHYYITFKRKLPEGVIWGHNLSKRITS